MGADAITGEFLLGARVKVWWQPEPGETWPGGWYNGEVADYDAENGDVRTRRDLNCICRFVPSVCSPAAL